MEITFTIIEWLRFLDVWHSDRFVWLEAATHHMTDAAEALLEGHCLRYSTVETARWETRGGLRHVILTFADDAGAVEFKLTHG